MYTGCNTLQQILITFLTATRVRNIEHRTYIKYFKLSLRHTRPCKRNTNTPFKLLLQPVVQNKIMNKALVISLVGAMAIRSQAQSLTDWLTHTGKNKSDMCTNIFLCVTCFRLQLYHLMFWSWPFLPALFIFILILLQPNLWSLNS